VLHDEIETVGESLFEGELLRASCMNVPFRRSCVDGHSAIRWLVSAEGVQGTGSNPFSVSSRRHCCKIDSRAIARAPADTCLGTDMSNAHRLTRRNFLAGAGVTVALPWLESLPLRADGSASTPPAPPQRLAVLFMGNGINPKHWWAKGAGADMQLGKSLEPLVPFRSRLNVITGLFNKAATGVGIHPGQTGNILSGARLQKGAVLRGGVSMDQVLAANLGEQTAQPSLVLGCEQPITGYHETNFSMAYSSHISWQNANSPVPMEVYPSLAFDSLFDNQSSRRTTSILDRVKDQAAALQRQVSTDDRAKLDEYLTSVREVEKRVERTRAAKNKADDRARDRGRPAITMPRPANGLPEDIREHMRLMCDVIALAFQTDRTRIATLLLCRDLSGLFYPFLDVRTAHHPTSH
jgi:Protein of unknown function (DUF1552)